MKDLLIIRIVDAIVASDLLEPEKKLFALEDLLQMYKDPEYFKKCEIISMAGRNGNDIDNHHRWMSSNLGMMFWHKMNQIIGEV